MKKDLNQDERVAYFINCLLGERGKEASITNDMLINIEKYFEEMTTLTSEKEMYILKRRFGINCEPLTLKELAEEFNVSSERIRQIEAKAIRKLKHPSRARIGYAILLGEELKPYSKEEKEFVIPNDLSDLLIEDIPFSIRTYNVLKRSGINNLQDLVNLSKDELIHRNIGRRGLIEIEDFLNKHNLGFKGLFFI